MKVSKKMKNRIRDINKRFGFKEREFSLIAKENELRY